jgi:hypothetical protein
MQCVKKAMALMSDPDNQRGALSSVAGVALPIGHKITLCPWKEQGVRSAVPKRGEQSDCMGFLTAQLAEHGNFTFEFRFLVCYKPLNGKGHHSPIAWRLIYVMSDLC